MKKKEFKLSKEEKLQIELKLVKQEIIDLKSWINDLQSGMYINCVYCGYRYGPNDKIPASMAQVLKNHIEICPKHPMSELKLKNIQLDNRLKEIVNIIEDVDHRCMVVDGPVTDTREEMRKIYKLAIGKV